MRVFFFSRFTPLITVVALSACTGDGSSQLSAPRESRSTELRLECLPARVIRLQDVACMLHGVGDSVEVTRWAFTNDEGVDLPAIVRLGEGAGDTIWAGPVAIGGVVEANVRTSHGESQVFGHFEVLPQW
jgi:hypothetical protein